MGTSCDGCSDPLYMSFCPGDDSGNGPAEPIDQVVTISERFRVSETSFTEDAAEGSPEAIGQVMQYRPIDYGYWVTIDYMSSSGRIVSALLHELALFNNSDTYIQPSGEWIKMVATPITLLMTNQIGGSSVQCNWFCEVNFRYTYSSGGTATRQIKANCSQVVRVP